MNNYHGEYGCPLVNSQINQCGSCIQIQCWMMWDDYSFLGLSITPITLYMFAALFFALLMKNVTRLTTL